MSTIHYTIFQILKDIILRHNVINGKRVHYRPGWDCHGLPIEMKAMTSGAAKKLEPLDIRTKGIHAYCFVFSIVLFLNYLNFSKKICPYNNSETEKRICCMGRYG